MPGPPGIHCRHNSILVHSGMTSRLNSRTGPANRHASRMRTLPIHGSRTFLPWHFTVSGPLSARNDGAERFRDLKRGRPNPHFLFAFFALSNSNQKRSQASPSAVSAYFAAFWLSKPCQGAKSGFSALNSGRRRWCRVELGAWRSAAAHSVPARQVPREPRVTRVLPEQRLLFVVGIKCDTVRDQHARIVLNIRAEKNANCEGDQVRSHLGRCKTCEAARHPCRPITRRVHPVSLRRRR